ncbi:DoxX family protein [Mucilaginibacter terrigena]|uniref:DoxX family protein n=1 Tax=Mucilaginibacter terrigena TaxID=2492395 RepID=A0A4V1ZBM3_9SPHI|nr:DoxX family protein [Mucilaginibacter terrigena]RYU89427.1 DoxX family protein [Mucilaginibacter terrigena]
MKITMIIVRTLMGLLLLFASVVFLFKINMGKMPAMSEAAQTYNAGLATVHMMNIVKIIELICALMFISGRFVTLANIVIFPIAINILLFHATLAPSGVPAGAFLVVGCLFLAYYYRKNYAPLFAVK